MTRRPAVTESRPHFARDFPRTSALDPLVDAFTRGDYARVRAEAPGLAKSAPEEDVRRAALTLLSRTKADPLAIWLLGLSSVLLALLTVYWILHGKAP